MTNLWLKIRIWTKVVVFVLVGIYIVLFVVKNSGRSVKVWLVPFAGVMERSVLEVIFITLVIGIVGTLLAGLVRGTIRQIRDVRAKSKAEQLQKDVAEMKAKAAKLNVQDEKPSAAP